LNPLHPLTGLLIIMLLIGITGGIACGKTEVAKVFQKRGAIILSGDEIGKEVVEKSRTVLKELVRAFGKDVLKRDGTLNRRKLGKVAFASKESGDKLNNIIHPHLLRELRRRIKSIERKTPEAVVAVDAALIVEWGLEKELDYLIFVESKREDKINRLQKGKAYSRKEALDRIRSQLSEKVKEKKADVVIKNDKGLAELRNTTDKVWRFIAADSVL
jgi:dephospho-CoA kinase